MKIHTRTFALAAMIAVAFSASSAFAQSKAPPVAMTASASAPAAVIADVSKTSSGGLTDEQFKAGLNIDRVLKQCKKIGGVVGAVVSTGVMVEGGKHNVFVEGEDPGAESPVVGAYAKKPSDVQLKTLVGRKVCFG